jgi:hypothetical protein
MCGVSTFAETYPDHDTHCGKFIVVKPPPPTRGISLISVNDKISEVELPSKIAALDILRY